MSADRRPTNNRPIDPRGIEVVDDASAAILARMTGQQRLAMMDLMVREARRAIEHSLRREHPQWPEEQVQREASRRVSHGAA